MDFSTLFWIALGVALLFWLNSSDSKRGQRNQKASIDPTLRTSSAIPKKRRVPQTNLIVEKPQDFEITDEIERVICTLETTDRNVFLTGKAGTGKSTLLRYFRATTNKEPVVVAPTGIAAVNVQGQTIHNFFGWGITITPDSVRKLSYQRSKIFRKMRMLVIDEISMVRADIFDCIDRFLRLNTGRPDLPFGGVQIVAIGDLYQLPPVVTAGEKKLFQTKYKSPFFFSTEGFDLGNFSRFELQKVFRQRDPDFVEAFNSIREGIAEQRHVDLLNQSVMDDEPDDFGDYVHLVTTNAMAKEINDSKMDELPAQSVRYLGTMTGTFKEKDAPTAQELFLKDDARVMLLNNDKERRWVNGDIVNVVEARKDTVVVEFSDQSIEEIGRHSWETIRFVYDEEEQKIVPTVVGSFSQIPMKPAWAMTIHKAQGQTFEKMFMDLGAGAFAGGQTYVALSRCKSLDGLRLAAPLHMDDIFVDEHVRDFMAFAHSNPLGPKKKTWEPSSDVNAPRFVRAGREKIPPASQPECRREQFVLEFIRNRDNKKYKGVHVVYSGLNKAFREKFNQDPVEFVKGLEKKGVVSTHPARGGVMLYEK